MNFIGPQTGRTMYVNKIVLDLERWAVLALLNFSSLQLKERAAQWSESWEILSEGAHQNSLLSSSDNDRDIGLENPKRQINRMIFQIPKGHILYRLCTGRKKLVCLKDYLFMVYKLCTNFTHFWGEILLGIKFELLSQFWSLSFAWFWQFWLKLSLFSSLTQFSQMWHFIELSQLWLSFLLSIDSNSTK